MKENLYVDNVISGCDQELDALVYYKEARSIMNEAHFNLRSWSSNSSSLRDQAAKDGTADSNEIVNILGLKWDPSTDTICLTSSKDEPTRQLVTKRKVLQVSSKVYDPLGLLSPVTIRAKLLIQELWQQQLEWDEPLSPELGSWLGAESERMGKRRTWRARKNRPPRSISAPLLALFFLLTPLPESLELFTKKLMIEISASETRYSGKFRVVK